MRKMILKKVISIGLAILLFGGNALGCATMPPTAAHRLPSKPPTIESTPVAAQPSTTATNPAAQPSATPGSIPAFRVETVLEGLDHPWDMVMLQDGSFVFSERGNKLTYVVDGIRFVLNTPEDTYVRGEGGLLGLALDPEFSDNRYVYACLNSQVGSRLDIRVVRWFFNIGQLALQDRMDIVTGLPANPSGRHSGCQLEFGSDGYLWVGTGDAANGTVAQDPQSLGGKVLRVDRDGNPAPGNLRAPFDPRIFSYGHRNVQGLGFFDPAKKTNLIGISVEHGSNRDDEVNQLISGNFGWNPVPGYNEAVEMTDLVNFPDAVPAIWSSGSPTLATSGATVIQGARWGAWDQAVAVAVQKATRIVVLELSDNLTVSRETHILQGEYGRIRTIQQGTDGNLYILTDNGANRDKILRLVPIQ
ncbi:MAG: PQQ-dependent sugar dehydrogenase [Anaerolineae bacterium]